MGGQETWDRLPCFRFDFVVVRDGKERVPVRVVLQPQRAAVKGPRGLTFRFATEPADAAAPGLR